MKPAYVHGIGLWTPGHANPQAWFMGEVDPDVTKPSASLLEGPLRRRATPLTRMGIEVLEQAASMGKADLTTIPSVWATAHGEHSTAIALLEMMHRGEGKLSPTKFHNSVHNTASGYASISTGNRSPSTTLTGGAELVASTFVEAACMLEEFDCDIVIVLADEPLLPPFRRADATTALAISLLLSPSAEDACAKLSHLRRDAVAPVKNYAAFGSLHISAGLSLIEWILEGKNGTVALEFKKEGQRAGDADDDLWCLDLEILQAPFVAGQAGARA